LDPEYDSIHEPDAHMSMEDDVDALDGVDLDGDEYRERDSDDQEEMIVQGDMVNRSQNDMDPIVDDQLIVRTEPGQEIPRKTSQQQASALAPWPQTLDRRLQPRTEEVYPLGGLEDLVHVMLLKSCPAVATLQEAKVAVNGLDVDVDQQVAIVRLMSLSTMALSLMLLSMMLLSPNLLSPILLSPMLLFPILLSSMLFSLRRSRMARQAKSQTIPMLLSR
jgi:hypothetical protein